MRRLGIITPSSNSVLEPTTIAVTSPLYPRVSTHYTRIEVKTISLEAESLAHFEVQHFVRAAQLLADARMDVIAWNGTAGAWQGIASDTAMCEAITQATGVPATTSTLAQLQAFEQYGISRYALAVPYLTSVRDAIGGPLPAVVCYALDQLRSKYPQMQHSLRCRPPQSAS